MDEMWVDDIEGLPHIESSIRITAGELGEHLGIDYVHTFKFEGWIDEDLFKLGIQLRPDNDRRTDRRRLLLVLSDPLITD